MKKYLLLLGALISLNFASQAAPGDTTWVQATNRWFTAHGNFDTTIHFPAPGTTYRNIYMIFTLGKYTCPSGVTDCGSWDYTVQNILMTPGGDTLELGRLITPYATATGPRTPFTWKQHYVFDVTDFASKLHDSATIRVFYDGFSYGFSGDIKFAFVEGTPERNVTGMDRLWHGKFTYGITPDINTYYPTVPEVAPAGTQTATMRHIVTGHGSDQVNGCCEFMSTNYNFLLNGSSIGTQTIWKPCGSIELYPQTGTWLADRANWCPGELIHLQTVDLPGITGGGSFNVGLQFDPYTSPGPGMYGYGQYISDVMLLYYGGMNKTLDGAIVDIIAPTNNENHFRENPICSHPQLKIRNSGSTAITSMQIQYGVQDSDMMTYSWTGTLNALQETIVELPDLNSLHIISGTTPTKTFVAKIASVNGTTDADATNDVMTSQFVPTPMWDTKFRIILQTNNEPTTGTSTSETKWEIFDIDNHLVASRTGADISTTYDDTVKLFTGCYRLVVTDGGCDGLHWWYWAAAGINVTAGKLEVRRLNSVTGSLVPMNGYNYNGAYNNDFGCTYSQYFTVLGPAAITDLAVGGPEMTAYPNPARGNVTIAIGGINNINGTVQVVDMIGRVVTEMPCTTATLQLRTNELANGLYTIRFTDTTGKQLQTRLVVSK